MSMLPYESVPQREGELQSQSHCVLCVFCFVFARLELESPLAPCPKCSVGCSSSWGPKWCSVSIWPCDTPYSWTTPDFCLTDDRSGAKQTLRRQDDEASKNRYPNSEHGWSTGGKHTISREKSASNAFQSGPLCVLTVIFPNYHEERRKTGTATSSNNPFDLTNEQNITVTLIRGWTVSESMVPHYPNHCYFPRLRFEVLSI